MGQTNSTNYQKINKYSNLIDSLDEFMENYKEYDHINGNDVINELLYWNYLPLLQQALNNNNKNRIARLLMSTYISQKDKITYPYLKYEIDGIKYRINDVDTLKKIINSDITIYISYH